MCCRLGGISVDAGADRGECDRGQIVLGCNLQRLAVTGSKKIRLPTFSAMPDGTNSVNYILGRQPVPFSNLRLTRFAASKGDAFQEKARPSRPMDGAIDASTAQKRGVRRD